MNNPVDDRRTAIVRDWVATVTGGDTQLATDLASIPTLLQRLDDAPHDTLIGQAHPEAASIIRAAHDAMHDAARRNQEFPNELRCNAATLDILGVGLPYYVGSLRGNLLFGLPLCVDDHIEDQKVIPYYAKPA